MRFCTPILSLAILAPAGCGAGMTGPRPLTTVADLAGTWTLTVWEAVGVADTTQRLDLMAELAVVATMEVTTDGAVTFTASIYRQSPNVERATITLSGDTLVYHEITGDNRFLLSGTRHHMIWRGTIPQYQDVNGDGIPDETRTRMEFVR
jgi:hypothetical protein